MRVDFNVPLDGDTVTDDLRIVSAIPTLQAIRAEQPRAVILMSHLGRPKGERNPDYSLRPIVPILSQHLGVDVTFIDNCVGPEVENAIENLPVGAVALLENTRFHPQEKENDPTFAEQLARLGDVYVNDAFGSSHRAHASTEGVAHRLFAVAGLLMEKEIEFLNNTIADPTRPFVAILGGAKISDKIGVIERLLTVADRILIGGGMANTFLKAQGVDVADSLVEEDALDLAHELISHNGNKIAVPVDAVIADDFSADATTQVVTATSEIPAGWRILDIGPDTMTLFKAHLATAQTVVWNGPMGVFELEPFSKGTFAVAETCASRADEGATVIIGGGDSAAAIRQAGLSDRVTHVSTGGGASLELLEGKSLPGLAALAE